MSEAVETNDVAASEQTGNPVAGGGGEGQVKTAPATQGRAEPKANGSLINPDRGGGDTGDNALADDSWKDEFAGGDKALRAVIGRFKTPQSLAKSYGELRAKLSSEGAAKAPEFPADGTPEQQAAWRKAVGVPDSVDGYKLTFKDGFVPSEADKPALADFTSYAHKMNWTPAQYNQAAAWFFDYQERAAQSQYMRDKAFKAEAEEILRKEWGPLEYKGNLNAAEQFFARFPESVRVAVAEARMMNPDGTPGAVVAGHPEVLKAIAAIENEINPAATIVPAGNSASNRSIDDEISTIEKIMNDPVRNSEYWGDPSMQARLVKLYEARERMQARAA